MTKLSLLIQVNPPIKLSYWFKFNQRINSNIKQYLLLNRKEKTKLYCSHLKSTQSTNSGPHNPLVHSPPAYKAASHLARERSRMLGPISRPEKLAHDLLIMWTPVAMLHDT
jgi:hypothetical protein